MDTSGCHSTHTLGGKNFRRLPTPLRSTSPPSLSLAGIHVLDCCLILLLACFIYLFEFICLLIFWGYRCPGFPRRAAARSRGRCRAWTIGHTPQFIARYLRGREGTVDWDTVASNCSTGNCLSTFNNQAFAIGGLRSYKGSGGLATAPKCMLRNTVARTWCERGLLQHLSPRQSSKYKAVEIQNPTSIEPPLRKARNGGPIPPSAPRRGDLGPWTTWAPRGAPRPTPRRTGAAGDMLCCFISFDRACLLFPGTRSGAVEEFLLKDCKATTRAEGVLISHTPAWAASRPR